MEREEILDMQRRTLSRIEIECKNDMIPAIFKLGDRDFPFDVLNLIVYDLGSRAEQCRGEFGFLNINEELSLQTFTAVVTLAENTSLEHIDEVGKAVNALNFYIPYGAFSYSKASGEMVYKLSGPLSTELPEELLYDQVQLYISNAYQMVDTYIDLIMDIVEGTKSAELVEEITGQ